MSWQWPAALLLLAQLGLVAGIARWTTPNVDEPAHLAAGLYHWQTGSFDAYRVNPPLIRLWATCPLWLIGTGPRFSPRITDDGSRLEWQLDDWLTKTWTYSEIRRRLLLARLMLLPFAALGGIYCWRWARAVYGTTAGWAAWGMWVGSPNLLAWSATVCPDVGATSLGLAACYHFRNWVHSARRAEALRVGMLGGLAVLAKSTWLALVPLLIVIGFGVGWRSANRCARWCDAALMLLLIGLTLNLGYGFAGSGRPLRTFAFRSQLLTGAANGMAANRFSASVLGRLPVPLPRDLVLGIDCQREEFERRKWSYLAGRWRWGSWPTYYLACALFKLPLGYLLLFTLGCGAPTMQRLTTLRLTTLRLTTRQPTIPQRLDGTAAPAHRADLWLLLGPAVALGAVVSSQTGFGHHFRYAFPCLPFVFIVSSACFATIQPRCVRCLATAALIWAIASSLSCWPRSHSYFNELATRLFDHPPLLESNLEWGEDLPMAADWVRRHPGAAPVFFALMTDDFARRMPIAWQPAPARFSEGWYVVSLQRVLDPRDRYAFLRRHQPVATLGASLRVYHLPP